MSEPRSRTSNGIQTTVKDIVIADDSKTDGKDTKCSLSVWGTASNLFADVNIGDGVTLLACTASLDDLNQIRISMNPRNAKLIQGGPRAEALKLWNCDAAACETVTSLWQPRERIQVDGLAVFTCASAMQNLLNNPDPSLHESVFQLNRVLFSASTVSTDLHTQNGDRLFLTAVVRDWSGRVEVYVIESGVPSIFGCLTREEVEAKAAAQTLEICKCRMNVRGVVRVEEGQVKFFVAETVPWDNSQPISKTAARLALGGGNIIENIVVACPLTSITNCPMLGLALQCGSTRKIGAYRLIMLVQGTQESSAEPLVDTENETPAFFVESKRVKCLLGDTDTSADLRGYCDYKSMLQYRLDNEMALVMISNCSRPSAGATPVLTVDYMKKVSDSNIAGMIASFKEEVALLTFPEEGRPTCSLASPEAKKARTLKQDPSSPSR